MLGLLGMYVIALNPCGWVRGLFTPKPCYRGYSSVHSFDAGRTLNPAWMAAVPDGVNLTSLSIPGTHDTMTHAIESEKFQCQNANLTTQLDAGVRYVDIRGRRKDGVIKIFHANEYTGYTYADVLLQLFGFLERNPTEAIVMRLKEEVLVPGGEPNTTFEGLFNNHRFDDPTTSPGCAKHLYIPESFNPLPTLGELRGKIIILQEFNSTIRDYGVRWDGPQMVLEDLWVIFGPKDLDRKFDAIRAALTEAATTPDSNAALYVSHLSAAVFVLPIEAAAGTLNGEATGMNDRTGEWLEEESTPGRTGVVIMDFPGQDLIEATLRRNKGLLETNMLTKAHTTEKRSTTWGLFARLVYRLLPSA
jgi:1-phosphatidylinositol phosphodiesterase